jgi:hypothetical protein
MNFTGRAELSRAVPSQSTIAKFHFNNRQYDWLGYARAQHSYFVFSVELLVLMDLDEVSSQLCVKSVDWLLGIRVNSCALPSKVLTSGYSTIAGPSNTRLPCLVGPVRLLTAASNESVDSPNRINAGCLEVVI